MLGNNALSSVNIGLVFKAQGLTRRAIAWALASVGLVRKCLLSADNAESRHERTSLGQMDGIFCQRCSRESNTRTTTAFRHADHASSSISGSFRVYRHSVFLLKRDSRNMSVVQSRHLKNSVCARVTRRLGGGCVGEQDGWTSIGSFSVSRIMFVKCVLIAVSGFP